MIYNSRFLGRDMVVFLQLLMIKSPKTVHHFIFKCTNMTDMCTELEAPFHGDEIPHTGICTVFRQFQRGNPSAPSTHRSRTSASLLKQFVFDLNGCV